MRHTILLALVALAITTSAATGAEVVVDLAPASTDISFELGATMHTVHGTASLEAGRFTIDLESGRAAGRAVVSARSLDTGNKKRDNDMHSKVLLSEDHERIVFEAERMDGVLSLEGASEITLVGTMELLGQSHPIRVPMKVSVTNGSATVAASFSVPYVAWGLKDPSKLVLRVAKTVTVAIDAKAVTVAPADATPAPPSGS